MVPATNRINNQPIHMNMRMFKLQEFMKPDQYSHKPLHSPDIFENKKLVNSL